MAACSDWKRLYQNITPSVAKREYQALTPNVFFHVNHFTSTLIDRLSLSVEMTGHNGCVNCLEWSRDGDLLASASDDYVCNVWNAYQAKLVVSHYTGHTGNIFSVKFMPFTNDSTVATGAGDGEIRVHNLPTAETTNVFTCHSNRVKKLTTDTNRSFLFWSASEDGTVRQFDLRQAHSCGDNKCRNILVDLAGQVRRDIECKCVSVNPVNPHQLAVGCNDAYARLYDMRMIKKLESSRAGKTLIDCGAVSYFVPGHLEYVPGSSGKSYLATSIAFHPNGSELLMNLGGEHIYLFDVLANEPAKWLRPDFLSSAGINGLTKDDKTNMFSNLHNGITKTANSQQPTKKRKCTRELALKLPPMANTLKLLANEKFHNKEYTDSIDIFTKALLLAPFSVVLRSNRAASLLKRKWNGDIYAALLDCQAALSLDASQFKAHFRLAKCFYELKRFHEAEMCLKEFSRNFPEETTGETFKKLDRGIKHSLLDNEYTKPLPDKFSEMFDEAETERRRAASDYDQRCVGHCNTTTDIKEANYLGSDGKFVIAGSDDGSFFIWERLTGSIKRVMKGDLSIVNCVQPHPTACILATSGIESSVKIWSPQIQDDCDRLVTDVTGATNANQKRMNSDSFEMMLVNMGYAVSLGDAEDTDNPDRGNVQCTPS